MKRYLALCAALAAFSAQASTITYSPIVGGATSTAAASTDTRVSTTLSRPAAWVGAVGSSTSGTIVAAATPNWTTNAFVLASEIHYVRMLSGAQRGHYFIISGNTADTLTVDAAGLDLTSIAPGDRMEVVPFWTLGTFYPASLSNIAFTESVSSLQTQLLFFDATATGINHSASEIYFFFNGAWRRAGQSTSTSYDNTIIYPDTYFLQRNATASTSVTYTGRVQTGYLGTIIRADTTATDNIVAVSHPVDITLDQTGLIGSAFTESVSSVKDQLLWFDPTGSGINRSASKIYFYYNGAWRQLGQPISQDHGSTILKAGSGFIIRKAANEASATWTFSTGI